MTRLHRPLQWAALVLLVTAAVLGLPTVAFARGGGGSHSGGGGASHSGGGGGGGGGVSGGGGGFTGGSGSSSGGGGGFSPLGVLPVAIIVILVVCAFIYVSARHPRVHGDFHPDSGDWEPEAAPAGPSPEVQAGVQAIRTADPAFEPESFLQRAEMAFLLVKRAYQDRNVHAGRAFLSPPLWQAWSQEVSTLLQRHQRPVLENLNVRGMQVPAVSQGGAADSIQVHFDYVAAVQFLEEGDGQLVSGSKEDQRLGEVWTFERQAGTKTVPSGGVTASVCPNCGALLKLNDDGQCDYCKADIASGRYDWVVTRMDSDWFRGASTAAAFGAAEMGAASGMAAIKASDPQFDVEAFRGRVQQAFFALQQAWQDRDLSASRPFMSPGLYLGWSTQVQQLMDLHKKNVLEGLRVDGIDIVKVVHGSGFDDVTVRVTATTADYEVDEQTGKMIFGSRDASQFIEYWTFQRSVGVQTTGRSILDKVCPNCGAPLEINQVGECRYCKAAVTSGRFDWVLSRIEQEDDYAG
ncbi:Tim44-like domain-containing protein [Candidatus Nephthysia bennettiae]|uniref:TIM44-like domain-containing protein n=1 Tax=Candidatus Nephthysia bennettiae TaxID=3127016 RepID=A0A934K1T6_9BACT|nr:TIM44-like domain-containing protein [Candidatus Dormibacteraeota bacterium]MBJ7612176.1 TIM44-like domain-containing protein [Candidatus Dormibacteraeota bacterium]